MTFTVDYGASPQFTLTCISIGGPATTVTWTRDSTTVMGDEMTVLDNATTAHYTHTLTVTGRLGGKYTCNVTNAKPSEAVANFTVQGNAQYRNPLASKILLKTGTAGSGKRPHVRTMCILRELLNEDVVERLIRHGAQPSALSGLETTSEFNK